MITGDHPDTAFSIAKELGIASRPEQCITGRELDHLKEHSFLQRLKELRVFARVTPEHKVRIVEGYRTLGKTVAMTGDGVNDAPSLSGGYRHRHGDERYRRGPRCGGLRADG